MSKQTGVFFHYQNGERLLDFPQALDGILERDNLLFYEGLYPGSPSSYFNLQPLSLDQVCEVHSREMVEEVMLSDAFEGALYSASGTVGAVERILDGNIDNAFVFTGYGDHHAGTTFFGGGCYFNGAAIAINQMRRKYPGSRVAIIDTDAHHGNGTWEIFQEDAETFYTCLCSEIFREHNGKLNIQVNKPIDDREYIELVREYCVPKLEAFNPDLIFWNWGYDGTLGDYGDIGITNQCHIDLASELRSCADYICDGRLVVVLCGGRRRDIARDVIPRIIKVLCE